ncbi:hypothetical protein HN587_00285 [Candidatus Woesearchaeota archaeon]|jgi:hypothetical protein|nr:hypothetical protein [Candidatus Woesearchaeota archaeon]
MKKPPKKFSEKTQFFAKSFEDDFILKTLKEKEKINYQSIHNIIKTNTIKPNTKSFGRERRLACSFLHENYLKTYRSQGLIFTTNKKPDFIYPFDLVLLSDAKKIIVQYYRIQNNLHIYYNHNLIPGFKKFVFENIPSLLKKFPTLNIVWDQVNKFRTTNNHKTLSKQKHKLIEYNEVIHHTPIKITPIAIFGYKKIAREIAKQHSLPHFTSAKKFYESLKK